MDEHYRDGAVADGGFADGGFADGAALRRALERAVDAEPPMGAVVQGRCGPACDAGGAGGPRASRPAWSW